MDFVLASGTVNGVVELWNLETFKLISSLNETSTSLISFSGTFRVLWFVSVILSFIFFSQILWEHSVLHQMEVRYWHSIQIVSRFVGRLLHLKRVWNFFSKVPVHDICGCVDFWMASCSWPKKEWENTVNLWWWEMEGYCWFGCSVSNRLFRCCIFVKSQRYPLDNRFQSSLFSNTIKYLFLWFHKFNHSIFFFSWTRNFVISVMIVSSIMMLRNRLTLWNIITKTITITSIQNQPTKNIEKWRVIHFLVIPDNQLTISFQRLCFDFACWASFRRFSRWLF